MRRFDVLAVGEDHSGLDDIGVLSLAANQERVIVTDDKDFGALVVARRPAVGVILLRTANVSGDFQGRRVLELLTLHPDRPRGHICVVEDGRFRFRKLPSM
jgi:predicted nuclease of predicted toxin-antitoxin system